ncbi:hypothetical protein PMAYCL1PPCAC_21586, partial [Pristionchus mayeri]
WSGSCGKCRIELVHGRSDVQSLIVLFRWKSPVVSALQSIVMREVEYRSAQMYSQPKLVFTIPGACFVPPPKIDVGVVRWRGRAPSRAKSQLAIRG